MTTPEQTETELIAPEEARQRLEAAIAPYLAAGWIVWAEHDYMARLTRGRRRVDFYVDLLGNISTEEGQINPAQDSGRLVAWLLLVLAFLLALALASALGWI